MFQKQKYLFNNIYLYSKLHFYCSNIATTNYSPVRKKLNEALQNRDYEYAHKIVRNQLFDDDPFQTLQIYLDNNNVIYYKISSF